MLYKLAHILRDRCPWIWDLIEASDSYLFALRYRRKLNMLEGVLKKYQDDYVICPIGENDIKGLTEFFKSQPDEAFTYFHPHAFDEMTLKKLQMRKSFLAYIVKQNEDIVGYFFLRCYFMGKCFRGYMVDYRHRNKGVAKLMSYVMSDIAKTLGIPSYGTINPMNVASMKSQDALVLTQLENGDYYVQYK